jgi:hypothetical protein
MKRIPRTVAFLSATILFWACGEPVPTPDATPQSALPAGHPVVTQPAPTEPSGVALSGEVLETVEAGGYTYARLRTGEGETWVAGPVTPLEVGSRISVSDAASMGSFTSTTLNRTFDDIYFVGAYSVPSAPPDGFSGTAEDVLSGGGYTYVRVPVTETITWIAGPQVDVQVGETVAWQGGNEMGEFRSRTLNRTFDNILFVERIWVER